MKAPDFKIIQLHILGPFDTERFERLARSAGAIEEERLRGIRQQYESAGSDEEREAIEFLGEEEQYYLDELKSFGPLFALTALYASVEQRRAKLVAIATNTKNDLHRIDDFEAELRRVGIKHADVTSATDMNELRLIVNNIKHSGLNVDDR